MRNLRIAALHMVCWAVFLSLPALFNPRLETYSPQAFLADLVLVPHRLVHAMYLVALFYFSYYLAMPYLCVQRRWGQMALYVAGTLLGLCVINYVMMPDELRHDERFATMQVVGPPYGLFMYIITLIVALALCLYDRWRKVYDDKLNAEIAFLRAQINPHFLFNALNSIYSLSITKSDDAPDAVAKLSGIMRYAVSDAAMPRVPLEREVAYITDYLALQQLRLSEGVQLEVVIKGRLPGNSIAPFLLIPFIENAFKFGVNAEEPSAIGIMMEVADGRLTLEVHNLKVTIAMEADRGAGLGLVNVRQRLGLLYPGRHELIIAESAKYYRVLLKLDLV